VVGKVVLDLAESQLGADLEVVEALTQEGVDLADLPDLLHLNVEDNRGKIRSTT